MNENRTCKHCETAFVVREEDLHFYMKISPLVGDKRYNIPPPTLCPSCRDRRRLAWRNERKLYRRPSSRSGKPMISMYSPDCTLQIFTKEEWWSDEWDGLDFAMKFDFRRGFFEQFFELQRHVPRPALVNNNAENSPYCNYADNSKNCHLITTTNRNEGCFYGWGLVENLDCVDAFWCSNCELCYECLDCRKCYNVRYAQNCDNCTDSMYLLNCRRLSRTLLCVNMEDKEYYIENKFVGAEIYNRILHELKENPAHHAEMQAKFERLKAQYCIRKSAEIVSCENCTGDRIHNSKNVHEGYDLGACAHTFLQMVEQECVWMRGGRSAV